MFVTHYSYLIYSNDYMNFNTIPNIDKSNNKIYIADYELELPEGSYEIMVF